MTGYEKFLPPKERKNWEEANKRGFVCLGCGRKPPEIMWMWEWSGKYCDKCHMARFWLAIFALVVIIIPLLFGLAGFLVDAIGGIGFALAIAIALIVIHEWFRFIEN